MIEAGTLRNPPKDIHSCIFRVLPLYQFYALAELEDYIALGVEVITKKDYQW